MKKIYLIAIATLTLFSACEEKVDLDLSFAGEQMVIEGKIVTEVDSSYIKLSLTAPYVGEPKAPPVEDAVVEVTKDNGTPVPFVHVGGGIYKPSLGYVGEPNHTYSMKVVHKGKEYTAKSELFPMYQLDSVLTQEFKPAQGFIEEGYAITYRANYNQPPVKYYWFDFGKNDSFENAFILFDNRDIAQGVWQPFELPFFRPQKGDSVMLLFRTLDVFCYNYVLALSSQNSGAPGPFQTPPANPPTNIKGGALGIFYATDAKRLWKIVN